MLAKKLELLPAKDEEGTPVDFVFISGLGQDETESWTAAVNSSFWPEKFLQLTIPNARVLAFGFKQSKSFSDRVNRVCLDLNNHRLDTRSTSNPIVFVARSLGGLVCAEIIAQGGTSNKGSAAQVIADSVQGIAFFGTPSQDSENSDLKEIIQKMMDIYGVKTSDIIDTALKLKDTFPAASEERHKSKKPVGVISFAEARQTKEAKSKLVDADAAAIPGHGSVLKISNNHQEIGTFEDDYEDGYKKMICELQDLATILKQVNETNGGRTFNSSVGNYAEGNVYGGQHKNNTGPLTYGSIGTQNFNSQ
ncbi:hypothetical protein GGS24DRAFT_496709 [Hypoxylon argillaceum]|nr:hypothetical protein GGS24DRAFT_496709 [Hypoxylon argillaceum]KAI1144744.1 hypothetical protein F4825DRAFT_458294 [Nemania diffusa]